MKTLNNILNGIKYEILHGDTDRVIKDICYDSRKVQSGSVFFALRGTKTDGHGFIKTAIEIGATAIVCEELLDNIDAPSEVTIIKTKDTRVALATASHNFFDNPSKSMKIIGITGTNGKTTITFILQQIYENAGFKTGVIGTTGIYFNGRFIDATHTTPESLELAATLREMADSGVDVVIMEVSSHALVQHRVGSMRFSIAGFTNLTHEHLDFHNTIEEYARAKKMLFDSLPENSIAIVFDNSPYSDFMLTDCKSQQKYLIGRNAKDDLQIKNEIIQTESSSYCLEYVSEAGSKSQDKFDITTPLVARFNIDNTAIAASMAYFDGIDKLAIANTLQNAHGAPGRMQSIKLRNGAIAIVDYSHTPDALEKALIACSEMTASENENVKKARIICVFGCGGDRDRSKRPLMGRIAAELADHVIITSDNPRTENQFSIIKEIVAGIEPDLQIKIEKISARSEAIARACNYSAKNDIILVAGKGHENYQIIGTTKSHFDDSEQLKLFA